MGWHWAQSMIRPGLALVGGRDFQGKPGIAPGSGFRVKLRGMAVESRPLFHPEVMRQQVRSFNLPGSVSACQPKLQQWASLIASGRAQAAEALQLERTLSDSSTRPTASPPPRSP